MNFGLLLNEIEGMNYILVDTNHKSFLPLTYTRPVSELRIGIYRISEKWTKLLGQKISYLTEGYLLKKFPTSFTKANVFINSKFLPNPELIEQIERLNIGEKLIYGNEWVACHLEQNELAISSHMPAFPAAIEISIDNWWDIFKYNGKEIENDLRNFHPTPSDGLSNSNVVIGPRNRLFIHPSARIEGATFNTQNGPIFIGEQAEVMEGSTVRGPFAALPHSVVKLGAKIYGPTTIGPYCKVGGELKNVVLHSYSNKSHDGYLGNSVLGYGVNIGAGTSCSNVKNTASRVKTWNYLTKSFEDSNELFLGCVIGDYSKVGINSALNTGTTIGVNCNVFGYGFPSKWIPNFSWGKDQTNKFDFEKAIKVNYQWTELTGGEFGTSEEQLLRYLHHRKE